MAKKKLKQVWEGVKEGAKEAVGAMNRNAFGSMGNAAASNIAPQSQIEQEDTKAVNEMEAATGLDLQGKSSLVNNPSGQAENVAQELKDAGVAVKPEYKEANPEVFNEEAVESGSAPAEDYTEATNTAVQEANNDKTRSLELQLSPEDQKKVERRNKIEAMKDSIRNKLDDWKDSRVQKAVDRTGDGRARNIMDAYLTGQITKGERNYYLADAFANFAKELGRNANNVGAAFTGGAIDNSTNTSAWQDRQNVLNENASQAAAEQEGGPAARKARIEEAQAQLQETMAKFSPQEKQAQLQIINNLANNAKSMTDLMKQIDSSELPDATKPLLKIFAQGAGSIPSFLGMLMTKAIF